MTHRNGRFGRRYNQAGIGDPRGSWAEGVPASAGFYPQQGVRFAGNGDPLECPQMQPCDSTDEQGGGTGKTFAATHATKPGRKPGTNGLPRHGAPVTRGANQSMRQQRRYSSTSLKPKSKRGLRRKSRK